MFATADSMPDDADVAIPDARASGLSRPLVSAFSGLVSEIPVKRDAPMLPIPSNEDFGAFDGLGSCGDDEGLFRAVASFSTFGPDFGWLLVERGFFGATADIGGNAAASSPVQDFGGFVEDAEYVFFEGEAASSAVDPRLREVAK